MFENLHNGHLVNVQCFGNHDSQIVRAKENLELSHGGSSYNTGPAGPAATTALAPFPTGDHKPAGNIYKAICQRRTQIKK